MRNQYVWEGEFQTFTFLLTEISSCIEQLTSRQLQNHQNNFQYLCNFNL